MSASGQSVRISARWSATVWSSIDRGSWVDFYFGDDQVCPLDLHARQWLQDFRDFMQDSPPTPADAEALYEAVVDRLIDA